MSVEMAPRYPGRSRTLYPLRVTSRFSQSPASPRSLYAVILIAVAVHSTIIEF